MRVRFLSGIAIVLTGLTVVSYLGQPPDIIFVVGKCLLPAARAAAPANPEGPRPVPAAASVSACGVRSFQDIFSAPLPLPDGWRDFNLKAEKLTVSPYPGTPIEFIRSARKVDGGHVTWIGRNGRLPGSSLVTVATDNGYDAILIIPGGSQFSYHVDLEGNVISTEAEPGEEGCANSPVQPGRKVAGRPVIMPMAIVASNYAETDASVALAGIDGVLNVDVLVLYDADTLAAVTRTTADPEAYIDGQSRAMLESCNVALGQSGVTNFVWRYLGCIAAPDYASSNNLQTDLALVASDTMGAWIAQQRTAYGADQVFLWHGKTDPTFSGMAYSSPQRPISAASALAIGVWGRTYKTMAHELGHNFGCQHDRGHAGGSANPGVPDGDGYYCYGQLWTDNSGATASTIMGYGSSIIPYYSNPNITLAVTAALAGRSGSRDWGTVALGMAEDQPRAAYNARVLRDSAAAMSALAAEISPPQITGQPAAASVPVGRSLSLSVTATGGALSYQWKKDGADLAGATQASYSVASATNADAGSYSVTASNRLGSVSSNLATVTITAAVTPAPAPSNGGGGGGGGAVSGWFVLALACLAVVRGRTRRRRNLRATG